MTDVRTELRRASHLVDVPDDAFDRLLGRRKRARERQRLASLLVALVVAAASLGAGAVMLSRLDGGAEAGDDWEPSRRLTLGPGEYFYLKVTSDEAPDGWLRDVETWWAPDGSGEVRNRSTRQDKYPYPPSGVYEEGAFPESFDVSPRMDPAALAARLSDGTFDGATLLLLETPYVTPELRAAAFEAASGLDGVTVIEHVIDPAGRPAVALETSEEHGQDTATWRLYFDPGTRQATGWTFVSTRGGSSWILLDSAIVGEAGSRPRAAEWLVPPVEDGAA